MGDTRVGSKCHRHFQAVVHGFPGVVRIEPEEVREFASGIDFSLKAVFALREHGGGIDFGPAWTSNQICRLQKHRGTVFPSQAGPRKPRFQSSIDGHFNVLRRPITEMSQHFAVFVWWRHGVLVIRGEALIADVHGDLDGRLAVHRLVSGQQGRVLGARA